MSQQQLGQLMQFAGQIGIQWPQAPGGPGQTGIPNQPPASNQPASQGGYPPAPVFSTGHQLTGYGRQTYPKGLGLNPYVYPPGSGVASSPGGAPMTPPLQGVGGQRPGVMPLGFGGATATGDPRMMGPPLQGAKGLAPGQMPMGGPANTGLFGMGGGSLGSQGINNFATASPTTGGGNTPTGVPMGSAARSK